MISASIIGCTVWMKGSDSGDSGDSGDITGLWYQVAYRGYRNGEYYSNVTEHANTSQFSMRITDAEAGVLSGVFIGRTFLGTFDDGIVGFYTEAGGMKSWFVGTVVGDVTYSVVRRIYQSDDS